MKKSVFRKVLEFVIAIASALLGCLGADSLSNL